MQLKQKHNHTLQKASFGWKSVPGDPLEGLWWAERLQQPLTHPCVKSISQHFRILPVGQLPHDIMQQTTSWPDAARQPADTPNVTAAWFSDFSCLIVILMAADGYRCMLTVDGLWDMRILLTTEIAVHQAALLLHCWKSVSVNLEESEWKFWFETVNLKQSLETEKNI